MDTLLKIMIFGRALCLAGALFACATPPHAATRPTVAFDAYVDSAMRQWGVPGVAVAIVKDGKLVAVRGYGVRTVGKSDPVDANTVFAIASVTKTFTAAAAAMLVDEHKIAWDDIVRKHLPSLELYDPQVSATVTVRDLLAQRTCLQDRNLLTWNSPYGHDELFRRLRFVKPACSFRDRFEYNNLNFMLAGDVEASAAGASWDELVQKRIFAPLGMSSSTTSASVARKSANLATPHIKIGGKLQVLPLFDEGASAPAGSIHSTATDMARWLEVQLGQGSYRAKRLWSVETSREMQSAQIPAHAESLNALMDSQFSSYGLGWFVSDFHGRKVVQHSGQSDGMHSLISMMPDAGLGIVVLTNTSMVGLPDALALRWFEQNLNVPRRDWKTLLFEKFKPENDSIDPAAVTRHIPHVQGTHPSLALADYAGVYHDDLLGDVTVAPDGNDSLRVTLLGRTGRTQHWHYDTFRMDWQGDLYFSLVVPLVTFELDAGGKPGSLLISEADRFMRQ